MVISLGQTVAAIDRLNNTLTDARRNQLDDRPGWYGEKLNHLVPEPIKAGIGTR